MDDDPDIGTLSNGRLFYRPLMVVAARAYTAIARAFKEPSLRNERYKSAVIHELVSILLLTVS
jgi:hypothetical protein